MNPPSTAFNFSYNVPTLSTTEDTRERIESNRPTKRPRAISHAHSSSNSSISSPNATDQFIPGWELHLEESKPFFISDLPDEAESDAWAEYRETAPGRAVTPSGSGLYTPPPSPGGYGSEMEDDCHIPGPPGGWVDTPVMPPGFEFYLSADFEIRVCLVLILI